MTLFDDLPLPTPRPVLEQIRVVRTGRSDEGTLQAQFEQFHEINPFVYDALVDLARRLVRRGRRKIGVGMLFEVLRWQYQMTTVDPDSDFRLNNNYRSRYARRIMENEPDLATVFEIRELHTP